MAAVAIWQCGGTPSDEATGQAREAIVDGTEGGDAESPIVYIDGPQGSCTGVLVAPTLVATARHCTAILTEGAFNCTSEGDLVPTGSGAGELGADNTPSQLSFFSSAKANAGHVASSPDAVGVQIVSTHAISVCTDDIAFVVISQPIPGLVPASIRLDAPTLDGENVSVWGYGLTEQPGAPLALRVFANAQIVGVGATMGTATPQAAPVRSVRVGPGTVTCNGDSGGPIMSVATGAVVALVSLGSQAMNGGSCSNGSVASTTGPLLSDYTDLVMSAFAAAGASPILEGQTDAGAEGGSSAETDAGPRPVDDAAPPPDGAVDMSPPMTSDSGCSLALPRSGASSAFGALGLAVVLASAALARRRPRT